MIELELIFYFNYNLLIYLKIIFFIILLKIIQNNGEFINFKFNSFNFGDNISEIKDFKIF